MEVWAHVRFSMQSSAKSFLKKNLAIFVSSTNQTTAISANDGLSHES
jgi:hypothetical protein